jgi:apolipoprotein N-acyltransferase
MNPAATHPHSWQKSLLWLALAAACFNAAYASLKFPAAGLLIFGYAFALVKLTGQPTVRRAFYFGLAAGFASYAPQLFFFWRIFSAAAVVLWLVLAFWIGLFAAIICGANRRWGKAKAAWLIPIVWTGVEYFRSELYPLKFSWLNIGYSLPEWFSCNVGMYGAGFVFFAMATAYVVKRWTTVTAWFFILIIVLALFLPALAETKSHRRFIPLVGIQLEFPPAGILPKMLDQALAKNTNAQIFVLSEYTLDGPPPEPLKNWCREHARFLVVGGKDFIPNDARHNYYNTAYVIGTNGNIVFRQVKAVPIQFFRDGLPAPEQKVWDSPWGKIGFCVCYDLSYTRVTDELIRQGAQLIICPTMDVESWGRHQHELHARVAPVRAAEYGVPIFRVASSGISQAVTGGGNVIAQTSLGGYGEIFSAQLRLPRQGSLPLDRFFAPLCSGLTGLVLAVLLLGARKSRPEPSATQP